MKIVKVLEVGYADENYIMPLILMSKKLRDELNVAVNDVLYIETTQGRKHPARVVPMFKRLVGQEGVVVNSVLANMLAVRQGETVTILGMPNIVDEAEDLLREEGQNGTNE